jgi:hypothetical protein
MADPFTLAALGIGTAASLAGGIYNAATLSDRKKKWKRDQQEQLRRELSMDYLNSLPMPQELRGPMMMGFKGKFGTDAINKAAEENFKLDPMTFVPFVQGATQLAGGIYDAAQPSAPQGQRLPTNDVLMKQKAAQQTQDALERAQALQYFDQKYGRGNW